MFIKDKYKKFKSLLNKSNLDHVLWFKEKFLPKKKDRG